MRIKNAPFYLIFILLTSQVFAQVNYKKGQIILQNGDTLRGLIDYRNWERNPKKINFKKEENSGAETYGLQELQSFEIFGLDKYTRAEVWKDIQSVSLNSLEEESRPTVRDTVFLRTIQEGHRLSLYELIDDKTHFFIHADTGSYQELQYKILQDKEASTNYKELNIYRNQLKAYGFGLPDQDKLFRKIDQARYNEQDLAPILAEINGNTNQTSAISERHVRQIVPLLGVGLTCNNISFSGEDDNLNILQSSTFLGYSIEAGADIYSKRHFQKLFFKGLLKFSNSNYHGTAEKIALGGQKDKIDYHINMNTVGLSFSLLYSFIRFNHSRIYAGAGAAYDHSFYQSNDYTSTNMTTGEQEHRNYSLESNWAEVFLRLGYVYNDKLELSILPKIGGTFANFAFITVKDRSEAFMVTYHF
jgi:hypothetical protein